ncbi:MAG: hypothetical protein PUB97_09510 [Ruminococcus sp.]|nr:hypothetical protein [Ruminococcus sp.]
MKRIIFVLIAASLLFVGCSEDESDTSVTENGECAVTQTSSETSASEISDKTAEYSNETSVFVDDKDESNDTDKEVNEIEAGIKGTNDNEGELPIIKEETSLESNKAEKNTAQENNTDASTETKTQTSNTEKNTETVKTTTVLTDTEEQTTSAETEKNTCGVIELPIIPVK